MSDEESDNSATADEGNEDINMRTQELEEKSERTHHLAEIDQGLIANSQKYSHVMQVRIEHAQGSGQVIHGPTGYPEGRKVTHDPTVYAEGTRVINEEEETEERERESEESKAGKGRRVKVGR